MRTARPMILAGVLALRLVRRFGWTAIGADRLLAHEQPVIFASNHVSHTDTAAILGTLPRRIRKRTCVAAALDVFGSADEGHASRAEVIRHECIQIIVAAGFHAFAFDRQGPPLRSIRTAVDLVRGGWNLLLFPEGTRSRSGEMKRFKPGVAVIARTTGRPVIPVHVSGGDDILPCGVTIPKPGRSIVRFGEPMHPQPGESTEAFAVRVQQRVRALAPEKRIATAPEKPEAERSAGFGGAASR